MDYFLTEQQMMIRETARQVAREKIVPVRAELDEKEEFPWEVIKACAAADLFAIWIPEAYGGLGGGILDLCVAVEELSRGLRRRRRLLRGLGPRHDPDRPLRLRGAEGEVPPRRGLRAPARGLRPHRGRRRQRRRGRADHRGRDGDHYVLNGTKQWITNGGDAEIYTVVAITDRSRGARGASTFIVEKGTPGFTFGKKEIKMGIRSSSTRELVFTDCRSRRRTCSARRGRGSSSR